MASKHFINLLGIVALPGLKEKHIILKLSLMLEELLKKNETVFCQVIDNDKRMTLLERGDFTIISKANIHFSIHANSGDLEDNFLGSFGTCTFFIIHFGKT